MIEILLPVYNGEKYLAEQIDSIISQTYKDWIIKIRNDGSTDGSQKVIDEYCRNYSGKIIEIDSPKQNIGLIQSLNILFESEPHGDYLMFADQDDYWLSNKIEVSLNKLLSLEANNNRRPIMICTDAQCVDESLKLINKSFFESQRFPYDTFEDVDKMLALNVVQGCTIILNKSATTLVFPLPSFINVHDMYIGAKIKATGIVEYIHQPTLLYRQHSNNELGCMDISINYYLKRSLKAISTIMMLHQIKKYIPGNISLLHIILYKFYYAYKRVLKK